MRTRNHLFTMFFIAILSFGQAQNTPEFFARADSFLKTHVRDGRVAYKDIKAGSSDLNALLEMAQNTSVSKEKTSEYQAFWINVYNLAVIKGVVENYPLKQPLDVPGFFDKTHYTAGGTSITLNDIENKLLRANFTKEPRFHFVLVCAGLGCPPIINEAYTPDKLEAQLERQTTAALNNPAFIQVNKNKVKISQIFEWYKGDFEQEGSVTDFINKYKTEKLPEKVRLSYYPYDWNLNDIK